MSVTTHDSPPFDRALFIDGQSVAARSGATFGSRNPSTGEVLATIALGSAADVDDAVRSARRAFQSWRKVKPAVRQQLLLALADKVDQNQEELSRLDCLEMGMPISRLALVRPRWSAQLRYYAGLAVSIHGSTIENSLPGNHFSYTAKEPIGVVGCITPWNSPMFSVIWKVAPALATGCTVVLKPSEEASLTSLLLAELAIEAGYPAGVFNVVTGLAEAGQALVDHPEVDKISFTGSTGTGQAIIRASAGTIKRLSLELGGKSPNIVFSDADLDAAIPAAAAAVFNNAGQMCSAGSRLFVEREVHDKVVDGLARLARDIQVGDATNPQTQMGPLISARQLARVNGYLDSAITEGAELVVGGPRGASGSGYFVDPTVFTGVADSMRIAREEIFGPVVSVLPFDSIDEVVGRANQTEFGLAAGVWTRDLSKAHLMSQALRAGSVWVNCYMALDAAIPFGGYKQSGYGRECGYEHLDDYLETKSVVIQVARSA